MLVSICIPAYNRPDELSRLLNSITTNYVQKVEVVICEDSSPKREEIKTVVNDYIKKTKLKVSYYENKINLGFDKNLRELISKAQGEFIMFMGDDDELISKSFDKLVAFLEENRELGYVLKSHQFIYKDKKIERFKYYGEEKRFLPGEESYLELFRKSVFISGFIINREYIKDLMIDDFDGTLLFQMYLVAEISLNYECAYFDEILTQASEGGVPFFGNSESEKELYTPGTITVENSLNFLKGYFKITKFVDKKYNISSTIKIKRDMSKYFYPSLAIQRNKGVRVFLGYVKELNHIGFNSTIYYYIYILGLLILGKKYCDNIIVLLKKIIGKTPKL